jgi:hypothetical protein
MKFAIGATLLSLAAVQVAAVPLASEALGPQDIGVPKMIAPKYRENAKRAIIRYPAFTLAAKGVSGVIAISEEPILTQ